jgi:hypothetical protein
MPDPVFPEALAGVDGSDSPNVYEAPHRHFGQRVLAADCSHVLAAIHTSSILEFLAEPS